MNIPDSEKQKKFLNIALLLSIITVFYNTLEGLVSVFFGYNDETLSLFGFGVDSFVEVISGLGIMHMTLRMKKGNVAEKDKFEKTALRITGAGFLLLTAGLITGAMINFINKTRPVTTFWGIIVSAVSIVTMYILLKSKLNVGEKLGSKAIIADARCTMTCFYLSFILLGASVLYEFFKIGYIDIIGSLLIAFFSLREGLEAIRDSRSCKMDCCCEK